MKQEQTDSPPVVFNDRPHAETAYSLRRAVERFERGHLHNILVSANWDLTDAAAMLDIDVDILWAKMKYYHLTQA